MKTRMLFLLAAVAPVLTACAPGVYTISTTDIKMAPVAVAKKQCPWYAPFPVASLVIVSNSDVLARVVSRSGTLIVPPVTEVAAGGQATIDFCVPARSGRSHHIEFAVVSPHLVDGEVLRSSRYTWSFSESYLRGRDERILVIERSGKSYVRR